jgi:hypothetical protein
VLAPVGRLAQPARLLGRRLRACLEPVQPLRERLRRRLQGGHAALGRVDAKLALVGGRQQLGLLGPQRLHRLQQLNDAVRRPQVVDRGVRVVDRRCSLGELGRQASQVAIDVLAPRCHRPERVAQAPELVAEALVRLLFVGFRAVEPLAQRGDLARRPLPRGVELASQAPDLGAQRSLGALDLRRGPLRPRHAGMLSAAPAARHAVSAISPARTDLHGRRPGAVGVRLRHLGARELDLRAPHGDLARPVGGARAHAQPAQPGAESAAGRVDPRRLASVVGELGVDR